MAATHGRGATVTTDDSEAAGFAMLASASVQEAGDMAAIARASLLELRVPLALLRVSAARGWRHT